MSEGLEFFGMVCRAADPAAMVRGLGDATLERLDAELAGLSDAGIPGVVAAEVTCEMARRWRVERQAERERS